MIQVGVTMIDRASLKHFLLFLEHRFERYGARDCTNHVQVCLRVYVPSSHLSHLHQLCYFQDIVKCISGVLTSVIVEKLTQEQFLQIERSVTGRIIKLFTNFVLALQWPPLCPCAIQSCLHVLSLPDLLESQYSST
jgi:hypothetical protein